MIDPTTDALHQLTALAATYGAAVVGLVVAVVVIFYGIKWIKRGASVSAPGGDGFWHDDDATFGPSQIRYDGDRWSS